MGYLFRRNQNGDVEIKDVCAWFVENISKQIKVVNDLHVDNQIKVFHKPLAPSAFRILFDFGSYMDNNFNIHNIEVCGNHFIFYTFDVGSQSTKRYAYVGCINSIISIKCATETIISHGEHIRVVEGYFILHLTGDDYMFSFDCNEELFNSFLEAYKDADIIKKFWLEKLM